MEKLALTVVAVLCIVTTEAQTMPPARPTNCTPAVTKACPPCPTSTTGLTTLPPTPSPPVLASIQASSTDPSSCQGLVYMILGSGENKPLCFESQKNLPLFQMNLCNHLGCGTFIRWRSDTNRWIGKRVLDNGGLENVFCQTLKIECKARPDSRELVGYKVVTGLFIALFAVIIFIRFGPGKCSSIRNKLFKQKREWIGPTQSQSVSMYRAQAGVPANSNAKRLSYPALERLSVYPSREPSSNRNSDCDSYN